MKHAILLALLAAARRAGPVRLVETHAGAGLYDLRGELATRSGEAETGIGRVMAAGTLPAPLDGLRAAVERENDAGDLRLYPGSPVLALGALGAGDRYVGCELRPDDYGALAATLARRTGAGVPNKAALSKTQGRAVNADGYAVLANEAAAGDLVLIDPPYERGDEYDRVVEAAALCRARAAACVIWAPIKDLETFDALLRRIEALTPQQLTVAEVRLRPLTNPMAMNGCAMVLIDAPDIQAEADDISAWVAAHCGGAAARGGAKALIP